MLILSASVFVALRSEIRADELLGVQYKIKKNDTFISILKKAGIQKDVRDSVLYYLEQVTDLKKIMPGEEVFIFTDSKLNFRKLEYRKTPADVYLVEFDKQFTSEKKEPEIKVHVDLIMGTVNKNIYNSLMEKGEKPDLAQKFSRIFAWQFDCNSDMRSGDKFLMLIEKVFVNGQFHEYGKIIYAYYENKERLFEAFYYNDGKEEGYYDKAGVSIEGSIMKAPLSFYTTITSGFSKKRWHPVLKKWLPHLAIDYAAPRGTPILAAGDGFVDAIFYDRYGGKIIRMKHDNGYETEYMHLLSYSDKAKIGKFVKQGEIIGYVGRSGTTTGYHLHFAVKKNGVYINPRRMEFKNKVEFSLEEMEKYMAYRDMMLSLVFAAKSFSNFPHYASRQKFMFEYAYITRESAGI